LSLGAPAGGVAIPLLNITGLLRQRLALTGSLQFKNAKLK